VLADYISTESPLLKAAGKNSEDDAPGMQKRRGTPPVLLPAGECASPQSANSACPTVV
jgi:hypothetical protein